MNQLKYIFSIYFILLMSCKEQNILLPEGQSISKESAVKDIHYNTHFYWLEYGEQNTIRCKKEIRQKYGLEIYQITGCEITKKLKHRIDEYNKVINEYMTQAYDTIWQQKLFEQDIDCNKIKLDGE